MLKNPQSSSIFIIYIQKEVEHLLQIGNKLRKLTRKAFKTIFRKKWFLQDFSKLAYFDSKTCSRMLGYSWMNLKVFQEVGAGRRKRLQTMH